MLLVRYEMIKNILKILFPEFRRKYVKIHPFDVILGSKMEKSFFIAAIDSARRAASIGERKSENIFHGVREKKTFFNIFFRVTRYSRVSNLNTPPAGKIK